MRNGTRGRMTRFGLVVGTVLLLTSSGVLAGETKKQVLMACEGDIKHFCGNVPPGQGRIKECMKEHLHELSPPCKQAILLEAMGER